MYILGIGQIGGNDSCVVLIKDGEIKIAIEEERLSRIKHVGGFPDKSIKKVLEYEGITYEDIDHIAIVDRPYYRIIRRILDWYLPKFFTYPNKYMKWYFGLEKNKNILEWYLLFKIFSQIFKLRLSSRRLNSCSW